MTLQGKTVMSDDMGENVYQLAVDIVRRDDKASTSYIQRKLRLTYNAAARIMERMEAEFVVTARDVNGKRKVIRHAK